MSKQTKLSRREFLKLGGGGLAAAAMLAACGGQQAATPAPAAQATTAPAAAAPTQAPAPKAAAAAIEFLAWGDTTDGPAWEKLIPAYTAKTGNQVNVTPVADPNANFYTKLQTLFAGGTPPHLASFQGWEWQTYADKDLLQPIDDWISRDKASAAYPAGYTSVEQSTKRNGKTYLVPLQAATMVMFYAKKIFDGAGVAYPKDDWTFEQFVETAKKLTDASKGTFGYQPNANWYRDIGWIVGTGKREFDSIIDPKKAQFATKEIVDRITTVAYDLPQGKFAPSPADTSGANTINTGKVAMKYEGPWFLPQLNTQKLRDEKKEVAFDVVRMPVTAGVSGRPHRGWGEGLVVTKSDLAESAWALAAWLVSEEGNKMYSELTGRIPSNLDLAKSWWVPRTKELYQIENGQAFLDAFKEGQIDVVSGKVPRSRMWSEVVKPTGWDAINNGSAKPADVFPKVDEKLNALLSA